MITGKLQLQWPKPSRPINGTLNANKESLIWWDDPTKQGATILAVLHHHKVIYASTHGIHFEGLEKTGVDRFGREVFRRQEWFISSSKESS